MIDKANPTKNLLKILEANDGINAIKNSAPDWVPANFAEQMKMNVVMEFSRNQRLQQCDPISIKASMMECAGLGLIPSAVTGHAYLVPYSNKCTLIIGYKGLITLILRNPDIQHVHPRVVRSTDEFSVVFGTEEKIVHVPNLKEKGEVTHFYAIIVYKNGSKQFEVMTKEEVDKIKNNSKSQNVWRDHYEAMGLKTVIRRLSKYLPSNSIYEKFLQVEEKELSNNKNVNDVALEGDYATVNSDEFLEKTLEGELSE